MFHRAGYKIILITTIAIGIAFIFIDNFVVHEYWNRGLSIAILFIYLFVLQQFRNPKRSIIENSEAILSPINGSLKSIRLIEPNESGEECYELIFKVSPFNFHIIRSPIDGKVISNRSFEAEFIHIQGGSKQTMHTKISIKPALFSQNSVFYPEKNSDVLQGEEIGFINFDGKVTMIVPRNLELAIKINDRVKAGEHIIATI